MHSANEKKIIAILFSICLFSLLSAFTAATIHAQSLPDRLAAQNTLFDEQYESDLRHNPDSATACGDSRFNNKPADYPPASTADRKKLTQAFLARLNAIPTSGFS